MKKLISMLSLVVVMMSSMAVSAMEDEMMDGYGFDDVTDATHYNHGVKWAKDQGYFYGQGGTMENPSDTFGPEMTFNRYELAVVTVRVAGYELVEETDCFGDEVLVEWAAKEVCTLKEQGVVQGKLNDNGDRYFDGASAVTNAEVAKLAAGANLGGLPAEADPSEGPWYGPLDEWMGMMNLTPDMVRDMNAPAKRQVVADYLARSEAYASGETEEAKWEALDAYLMMYGDDRHMWGYNTPENRGEDLSGMVNDRYMGMPEEMDMEAMKMAVMEALEMPAYTADVMGVEDYDGEDFGMAAMEYMDGTYYLHAELELPELEEGYYYLGWVVDKAGEDEEDVEDMYKQLDMLMYNEETSMWELYFMEDEDYSEYMYFVVSREMEEGDADDRVVLGQGMFEEYVEMTPEEMLVEEVMMALEEPAYHGEFMAMEGYEVEGMTEMKYMDGTYYFHVHMMELPELPEGYDHYTVELYKEAEGEEEAMMHELGMLMYDEEMGWHLHYKGETDYSDYMMVKLHLTSEMPEEYPAMELAYAEYMDYADYKMMMALEMPAYTAQYAGEGDYADVVVRSKTKYMDGMFYHYAEVDALPELEEGQYYEGWLVKKTEGEEDMKQSTGRLMENEDMTYYYQYYMSETDYSEYMYYVVTLEYEELDEQVKLVEGMYEMVEEEQEVDEEGY